MHSCSLGSLQFNCFQLITFVPFTNICTFHFDSMGSGRTAYYAAFQHFFIVVKCLAAQEIVNVGVQAKLTLIHKFTWLHSEIQTLTQSP